MLKLVLVFIRFDFLAHHSSGFLHKKKCYYVQAKSLYLLLRFCNFFGVKGLTVDRYEGINSPRIQQHKKMHLSKC